MMLLPRWFVVKISIFSRGSISIVLGTIIYREKYLESIFVEAMGVVSSLPEKVGCKFLGFYGVDSEWQY